MRIGHSVQLAVEMLDLARRHPGERRRVYGEAAMLHACNAVDATGKRTVGGRVGHRFRAVIRSNFDILGAIGIPVMDLERTRFPYPDIKAVPGDRGAADIADLLYHEHRCALGHGDEVKPGFALIPDDDVPGNHRVHLTTDAIRLPEAVVLGLAAVAVLSPVNADERAWGAVIPWGRGQLVVNDWWGRAEDFRDELRRTGFNTILLDETPDFSVAAPLIDIVRETMRRSGIPEME